MNEDQSRDVASKRSSSVSPGQPTGDLDPAGVGRPGPPFIGNLRNFARTGQTSLACSADEVTNQTMIVVGIGHPKPTHT
jgi:hypothetical protein